MSVELVKSMAQDGIFKVRIDEASATTTYYGFSKDTGASDNQSEWLIARLSGAPTDQVVEWASSEFDKEWSLRTTYFGAPPFTNINSLEFDGINDYLQQANDATYQFARTDAWSSSVWIKPVKTDGQFFGYQGTGANSDGYAIRIDESGGTGRVQVMIGSGSGNRIQVTYDVDSLIFDGSWHHLCVTKASGTSVAADVNLYVDGALQSQPTPDNDGLTNTINYGSAFKIYGARHTNANNPFQGKLDEISLYDKELSLSEVNELIDAGCPADANQASFVANQLYFLRIDGSIFPTIDDIGDNGNEFDGTMVNMTAGSIGSDVCS